MILDFMNNYFNLVGLILNVLGSLSLARGLFISKKEALELGISRWAGETDEENLKLPQVRDRLKQKKWGKIGAILLSIGLVFQLIVQVNSCK